MTEYGRGPGSEPWHPEDPAYGDGGWGGQEAHAAQSPYGGQPQHHPQEPQQPQQQYGDWGSGQQAGYDQGQQQYYAQGHQQQYTQNQQYGGQPQQQYNGQGGQAYQDQSGQQYGGGQQYNNGGQRYNNGGQQYNNGGQQYSDGQQHNGGWDNTGQQHQQQPQQQPRVPYGVDPNDPYGGQSAAYGGQRPDQYGTPDAYPPPQPPSRRRAEPEPPPTDWDPGPDQGEHAFFAGGNDEDDDDADDEANGRRRGKGDKGSKDTGKKKGRSGIGCMVLALVFTGVIGGVGYYGYQFYQERFGAAPDYAGDGTSEQVTVVIPKDAFGSVIGQKLKAAGVVKSVDAFVSAQASNPNGDKIQPGSYLLKKEMSAKSAVALMLDPKSQSSLVVKEGQRNGAVYAAIDKQLGVAAGTTKDVAKKKFKSLGLPDWANSDSDIKDPLEGFLYPATYPAAKGMKPETVLKEMVAQANKEYAKYDLETKAKELNLKDPLQVITVASLVQAEGITSQDFKKMAAVVYNRLKSTNTITNQKLEFDSAYNYLKGQSKIDIVTSEIRNYDDPYNTYFYKGLPPGPIGNPGQEALKASVSPDSGAWMFFISVDGKKTDFTKTLSEHEKLVQEFNARRNKD
ncbi:endolytic transglycosylase MltG [Streptomyces sp. NBC_00878]|uniref:endolytic transglycosylase MltG n=1 Tax=Streptomyces sp. NBC_00878 TaxID=2975854 RepID=UPI0022551A95|nr:endolytic transglycosylase MltG [Streptomyces sp. NBC_00878]MCX4910271.1 endolytic transglycosylase MltG [Streptomyces sp. NBC_00878]